MEKEELRNALVLTQESAAIQILLECCLPTAEERASGSKLSALQAQFLFIIYIWIFVFILYRTLYRYYFAYGKIKYFTIYN